MRGQGLVRRVEAWKQRVDDPFGIFRIIILATKSINLAASVEGGQSRRARTNTGERYEPGVLAV